MRLNEWDQQWWNRDIEMYMKLKANAESSAYPEGWLKMLEHRRKSMVERYGESAMKGI